MINITVRADGVITNELTEFAFMDMVTPVYGADRTLDEYITLFNEDSESKGHTVVVHKEVPNSNTKVEPADEDLDAIEAELDDIVTFVDPDQDPEPFLEKLAEIIDEEGK